MPVFPFILSNNLPISHHSATMRAMPTIPASTVALLLASGVAMAAQFCAGDFSLSWPSSDGSAVLVAANAATNGWINPALVGGGVSFAATTNGTPTPLWFGDGATGTVAYAALVVDCGETPVAWSTLLDAPFPLRAEPVAYLWQSPDFATNDVAIAVDTATDETIPADGTKHLVEAVFAAPVAVSELSLGGHPATPAWNRSWPGRVYEAVFLDAAPQGNLVDALRSYLSQKWGLGFDATPPQDARELLRQFGVKTDPLFSSVIIAR